MTDIKTVKIPAGSFIMGSDQGDSDELPMHTVKFEKPFYMSETQITNKQYAEVMGTECEPGTEDLPVTNVSHNDAVAFCEKLSALTGGTYRLPTEAEWEYACRAGTTTQYHWGDAPDHTKANFGRHVGKTTPVKKYAPNAWGLYGMHGNVWEWCADSWHGSYEGAPTDGSAWE